MICMKKSKNLLSNIGILLSVSLFSLLFLPLSCYASEKTYLLTESQLTTLEQNLATLKTQNQTLQKQSEILQAQSTQLQEQVSTLTQSLMSAQELLNKYESNQQENKTYTIGVGGGSNGLGVYASKDETWLYLDKDTVTIGWQYKF